MAEVGELKEALKHKEIPVRTDAARQLARTGGFDDVEVLIHTATSDKSPSVRLYAAAAASNILMRGRGAHGQVRWNGGHRQQVLDWLRPIDPGTTPSLLICLSAFPDSDVIKRLVRMLRDPRYGVRAGAALALRRMAVSAAAKDEDTGLREWVGEALDHRKLPADAAAELIKLSGQVGWDVLLVKGEKHRGAGMDEALDQAHQRCAAREAAESWHGVWLDDGRDVLEEADAANAGWVALDGLSDTHRMIWAPRTGEEGESVAIQSDGRTFWKCEGKPLAEWVLGMDRELTNHPSASIIAASLGEVEGAIGRRALALLWARSEQPLRAVELLEADLKGKKPRNDLFFIRGLALERAGQDGKPDLARFLQKAKKSPWREEAEHLLGSA